MPLRPSAPAFYPSNPRFTPQHVQYEPVPAVPQLSQPAVMFPQHAVSENVFSDLTLFMMRKQLVPERFTTFDDKAESYNAWKFSFLDIVNELKVSKHEELELLVNKLSGRSKDMAVSIRNANPGEVNRAVMLI